MSQYAEYLRERTYDQIIETEKGFVTWRHLEEKRVYIVDIFVHRDFRGKGVASELADEVVKMAKKAGCKELIGIVAVAAKNSTDSIKVLLAYGMTLSGVTADGVIFRKEI
jgi:GNAT superfamily N-acetyltransferase